MCKGDLMDREDSDVQQDTETTTVNYAEDVQKI